MRLSAALSSAFLLALAPAALAFQEPPPAPPKAEEAPAAGPPAAPAAPARHENKITDEAKAAIAAYEKVVYSPVALGLKEMKGSLLMKVIMPGMEDAEPMEGMPDTSVRFGITFTAPKTVAIEASTDNPMLMQAIGQMKQGVQQMVMSGMGILDPQEAEFDMSLATEGGAKVLVISTYEKGAVQGEMRLTLDAVGLPSKGCMKATDPNTGMEQTIDMTFTYVKDGERHRLDKQTVTIPMFPDPLESNFTYAESEGIKVLSGIHMKGPMGMTFSYKYTELSINGKKVALPEETKKEATKAEEPKAEAPPVKEAEAEKKAE